MAANGTRNLILEIAGEEVDNQISKGVITAGASDADFISFRESRQGGGRSYTLDFTAVQDHATGSIWDTVWENAGETVAFLMRPYGNDVPSVSQPHYSGNVTVQEPDGDFIGGEANSSTSARFTIECSWPLEGKPTKITAP